MPKGLTPKKRQLRKQTKPLRQAQKLVKEILKSNPGLLGMPVRMPLVRVRGPKGKRK